MKQARLSASVAAIMAGSAFASSALANEVNIYSARHYDYGAYAA